MTIGIYLIIILILGYFSVYLRERLNLKWLKPLTFLGILIHENSHALASLITGGKVTSFKVSATSGSVTHYPSRVPIIGPMLVAIAPLLGGLAVIGLVNYLWLETSLGVSSANLLLTWQSVIASLNLLTWQGWVLIILFLNVGVMLGPSVQDLKNIWPLVILSFLIKTESLAAILALVVVLIAINVVLFLILFMIKRLFKI